MPDITKMKSVAVPIETYKKLEKLKKKNSRSIARQIAYLVDIAYSLPSEKQMIKKAMNGQEDG